MSAKDKIDAIFRENERNILDNFSLGQKDANSVSVTAGMLDVLQTHMNQIQPPTRGDVKIHSKRDNFAAGLQTGKPKKLTFAKGNSQKGKGSDVDGKDKLELVLDIKASKSLGNFKLPKVQAGK
jgi:hypothetical protein